MSQTPMVPEVTSCSATFCATSRMVPSPTMRPSVSIAVLPAGPSKATLCRPHPAADDVPVDVEALGRAARRLALRVSAKVRSQSDGGLAGSPPALATRSPL